MCHKLRTSKLASHVIQCGHPEKRKPETFSNHGSSNHVTISELMYQTGVMPIFVVVSNYCCVQRLWAGSQVEHDQVTLLHQAAPHPPPQARELRERDNHMATMRQKARQQEVQNINTTFTDGMVLTSNRLIGAMLTPIYRSQNILQPVLACTCMVTPFQKTAPLYSSGYSVSFGPCSQCHCKYFLCPEIT